MRTMVEGTLSLTCSEKVREYPGQRNAFSLPANDRVCRFATPTCSAGCYAKKGRLQFANVQKAFQRNLALLEAAATSEQMAELLCGAIAQVKFNIFRIHVSGEFYSSEYAKAWRITCAAYGDVRFWSYTRSRNLSVLSTLAEIPNLRILLSCDRDNWRDMLRLSEAFPRFGLTYYTMGETPPERLYARGQEVPEGCPLGLIVFPDQKVRRNLALPGTCPTEVADHPWPKLHACVRCRRCWR